MHTYADRHTRSPHHNLWAHKLSSCGLRHVSRPRRGRLVVQKAAGRKAACGFTLLLLGFFLLIILRLLLTTPEPFIRSRQERYQNVRLRRPTPRMSFISNLSYHGNVISKKALLEKTPFKIPIRTLASHSNFCLNLSLRTNGSPGLNFDPTCINLPSKCGDFCLLSGRVTLTEMTTTVFS